MQEHLTRQKVKTAAMDEVAESLGDELEWLWDQVTKFALHEQENHTILMVIEPENSKTSWETWVEEGDGIISKRTHLLL